MPMAVPFWLFFVVSSVLGVGFGITITTTTVTAQNTVEPEKWGLQHRLIRWCVQLGRL